MSDETTEAEYIRLTDLTKLRIARQILYDVMEESLPQRNHITCILGEQIAALEDHDDE